MPINLATYVPGDAWSSPDFLVRASAAPRVKLITSTPGAFTDPSYFEFRGEIVDREVQVAIASAGTTFVIHLQRSYDDGVTWETAKVYSGVLAQESMPYTGFYKLRLLYVSGSSSVTMRLWQDL